MFSLKQKNGVEYVIAALGNPGREYAKSRHNAGFLCADALLANEHKELTRAKFSSLCTKLTLGAHRVLLLLPQTFMNDSGRAVAEAMHFYKLPPENLIVLVDDIHLDCGMIRVRAGGSAGGHNGLKSITSALGSSDYARIRLGVGAPKNAEEQIDWVLGAFSKAEQASLESAFSSASDALMLLLDGKANEAMNRYNHKVKPL